VHAADLPAWTVKDVMALARLQQFQLSESLFAETDNALFALAYGPGAPLYGAGDKLTTWIRAQQPTHARYYTLVEPGQAPTFGLAPGPGTPALAALAPWAGGLAALGARVGALHEALRLQAGEVGSNNWVVGGTFAESTHAMVANDPHLSLPYPPNFYLSAMTSARASDNLDLTGGAFPGAPGAQVGRGRNVGWGVTVVGYDVTDLYREQFLPANVCGALGPYCVLYKGVPTGLVISPQAYWVRRPGDGSLQLATDAAAWGGTALLSAQESAVVVVPHHGPVVQAPDEAGHAISVRWTGQEGWTNDLRAFLRLGTATSVDDAMEAVRDWSTGAQNFVFADDQGHIGYFPHALVPIRDFADIRVVGGAVQPPWFPLPGDGTAEWGHAADLAECSSAAAPRKCFLPDAELPQGKDPAWGFFITANSDPRGVSHDNNPLGHPPYLSFDWDEIGFRQARITERLAAYTQGGGKISQAEMESVQGDHYSLLGWNFHQILMNPAFDAAEEDSPAFAAARAMLDDWSKSAKPFDCPTGLTGHDPAASPDDPDPVNSANSAACLLFHHFVRDLAVRVFADDLAVAGLEVNSGKALKGLLYMLETNPAQTTFCDDVDALGTVVAEHSCAEQAVISLATAWETLSATTGPTSAWRWGRVHTFTASSNFPTVTTGYTAGPFARPGGAVTVDVGNFPLTLGPSFAFSSSANVRHVSVMDPAEPICRMQLPGPERDGPYGVLEGPDLIGMWVDNTYFDYANWTQVQARAVSTQDFAP
jgi:penicillin amidase